MEQRIRVRGGIPWDDCALPRGKFRQGMKGGRRRLVGAIRGPRIRTGGPRHFNGSIYPATLIETFSSTSFPLALSTSIFRSSGLIEFKVEKRSLW